MPHCLNNSKIKEQNGRKSRIWYLSTQMHDHSLSWLGTNNSIKRKSDNLFLCNVLRTRISKKNRTQWPKEKVQKDKQRSAKHTHKTKDRITRTPLKIGGELRCSERASSSCSTSGTRCVNLGMRKGPGSVYDKWNISVIICDTDIGKYYLSAIILSRRPLNLINTILQLWILMIWNISEWIRLKFE